MTHFSDVIRTGSAGLSPDTRATPNTGGDPGVATSPVFVYDIVPSQLLPDNIAAAQTVSGAPGSFTISGGTGTTTTTINGVSYVDLGCARAVSFTGVSGTSAVPVSVAGLDDYKQPLTQTITGPDSVETVNTTKTFRYVSAATASGNTVEDVSIGTADIFGLPYKSSAFGYNLINWDSTVITANTGFTAAVTTTATATTGDVRGTYAVQSASDSSKRLTVFQYIQNPNSTNGAYGVPQA